MGMNRRLLLLAAVMSAGLFAQTEPPPVTLVTTETGGLLSYEVINHSPYRITRFQVRTRFTSGGFEALSCWVGAEVKTTSDLTVRNVCQVGRDAKGKLVSYEPKLIHVEFANGMKWDPPEQDAH
jgi:hypothetical protein